MRALLLAAVHVCLWLHSSVASFVTCRLVSPRTREHLLLSTIPSNNDQYKGQDDGEQEDTVRVRIWRALVAQKGREMSLAQLSSTLGERRSDVRHHLSHVEKQCKTLQSKSEAWRLRRGLPADNTNKLRITTRRGGGKRNELFIKLQ